MQCPRCGILASIRAERCPACGLRLHIHAPAPAVEGQTVASVAVQYAGFWRRLGAFTIDSILLAVIWSSVVELLRVIHFRTAGIRTLPQDWVVLVYTLSSFTSLLAPAMFESSRHQATPGKMLSGIIVTNTNGGRIGFGRALARNFLRLLFLASVMLSFTFLLIAIPGRKRGLHDMMTGCLVVVKEPKQVVPTAPRQPVSESRAVTEVTALAVEPGDKTAETQKSDENWLYL